MLETLAELELALVNAVRGYAAQLTAIQSFVGDAAVRRTARGASSGSAGDVEPPGPPDEGDSSRRSGDDTSSDLDDIPEWFIIFGILALYIIPIGAWLWFNSHYKWWEYVLIGVVTMYGIMLVMLVLRGLTPESPSRGLPTTRRMIVLAIASVTVIFVVRWHSAQPGGWEVIALGLGLVIIPAEIATTQMRRRATRAQPDQLQTLALDFVDLLDTLHPAVRAGTKPPEILVGKLEASAKRVLAASERAALRWNWKEQQVQRLLRESGGCVAAGLRWHKRLVVMPTADASSALFTSFGYGLVAAATGDWKGLMFEPVPSAAQSFWQRYRPRLALAGILGAFTAFTFVFPNLLPSTVVSQLRGLLVLTAAYALLAPPTEIFGHAFDAFGSIFSSSAASKMK